MQDLNIKNFRVNFYTTSKKGSPFFSKRKIKKIFEKEKLKGIEEINVIIVGDQKIRKLNKKFLKRDRITDVLSFNLGEVAEIYICNRFIKEKEEFLKLLFHGFAHILGFDHKNKKERKIMENYENKLLEEYKK